MEVEIFSYLNENYLLLPKAGDASVLFLDHLYFLHSIDAAITFLMKTEGDILSTVGPDRFCIELMSSDGSQANIFIYELFKIYINANLVVLPGE